MPENADQQSMRLAMESCRIAIWNAKSLLYQVREGRDMLSFLALESLSRRYTMWYAMIHQDEISF